MLRIFGFNQHTEPRERLDHNEAESERLQSRSNSQSLLLKITLVTLSFFFTLLVLEVGIRMRDASIGRGFFYDGRNLVGSAFDNRLPFRTFGFYPYTEQDGVKFITSRHGELYPFEKPEGTFRIVAFGGSTTENVTTFQETGLHYPLVLQNELRERTGRDNIEVINVGNASYATPHSLILLELDVISWDPNLIIISHNTNDRSVSYWPEFAIDYSNKYSDPYYLGEDYKQRFTALNAIFQHSQLYWIAKGQLDKIVNRDSLSVKRISYGDDPNPEAVAIFQRNIETFIQIARSKDIDVLLATQAYDTSKAGAVFESPYNEGVRWPLIEEIPKHHARYNKAIEETSNSEGTLFLDNAALMNDKEDHFFDDIHYTPLGVEVLGNNFADFLLAEGIVK